MTLSVTDTAGRTQTLSVVPLASVWLLPENSTTAPALTTYAPLLVPPSPMFTVPLSTSTVPRWASTRPLTRDNPRPVPLPDRPLPFDEAERVRDFSTR